VALYYRFKPFASLRDRFMHALTELRFNLCQLRSQVLANHVALYGIVPVPVLPADVRESQKIERLTPPFSSSFPVVARYAFLVRLFHPLLYAGLSRRSRDSRRSISQIRARQFRASDLQALNGL